MRVRAIAAGHVGKPITVERKFKRRHGAEVEQVPADYILPGDVFEWDGPLGTWMRPIEGEPAELDRKGIIAKLDAASISYFKGASLDKLRSLLPQE